MALGAPDASGRRRPEPVAGTEFIIDCDRVLLAIGQGPELGWLARGADGRRAPPRTRGSRPTRSPSRPGRPGVFGTGDVRIGAATVVQAVAEGRRAAYAMDAYLQGQDLDADPDPPDAGRAAARVPVHRAVHRRGQGAAPPAQGDARRRSATRATSSTSCPTRSRRRWPSRAAASSAPARPSATATCGARASSTAPRSRRSSPSARGASASGASSENRFTGHQPRLHPRRQPRVHPSRAVALHRLRPLRQRVQGGRRRRLLRLHAHRLRHAGHDAARHEPQHHAVRLLRPLRRDLPDRRADAQAARAREVRRRREPLHPVRHLRRRVPLRRAALRPGLRASPREPRRSR